jgi:hypothetical protein
VDFQSYSQRTLQFKEGLSITRGNHSFRMGSELKHFHYVQNSCSRGCNGIFTFRSMEDFVVNIADDFQVFAPGSESPKRNMNQILFGGYFQDNWVVKPSLTLNLGMRYEFVTVPNEANNLISNLRNFTDTAVSAPAVIQKQYPGFPFAGEVNEFFSNATQKSFSPRFGFAWAPGDRKTSLRGGYAIFYDYPMLFALRTSLQELPPFVATARLRNRSNVPVNRRPMRMQPQAVAAYQDLIGDPAFANYNIRYMEYDQNNTYVHRWSFTLQRELPGGWGASAGYTGSRGLHLLHQSLSNIFRWDDWPNQPTGRKHFTQQTGTARCPGSNTPNNFINPCFGEVRTQSSDANSYFHGLALGLNKRLSHGFEVQFAYNYSKSTDQGSGVTSGGEEFPQGQRGIYYWDRHLKKGLSAFDIRNSFSANFTWDLPGQNLTGIAKGVLGGWKINSIISLIDGHPLTVEDSSAVQTNTIGDDENLRVNLLPGGKTNPVLGGPDRYYDPAQFAPSVCQGSSYNFTLGQTAAVCRTGQADYQPGYFGTLGSATVTSPGTAAVDLALQKNFAVREGHNLRFSADIFNLFNHANFGTPNMTLFINEVPNAEAARVTSTSGSARQIQFSLRYSF